MARYAVQLLASTEGFGLLFRFFFLNDYLGIFLLSSYSCILKKTIKSEEKKLLKQIKDYKLIIGMETFKKK